MDERASSDIDWNRLRGQFPVLQRKTYLNSCSYGALATSVREAFLRYLDTRESKGSDWDWWVTQNENIRQAMANFLGASPDEIAITTSASAGINSLASALDFSGRRSKVVISDFEFPTNGQIWNAQAARGARVVRVPAVDGFIPLERFADAIDEDTLLVAVTNVCFRNGAKLDVAGIAELAQSKGAMILVDGYQALGSMQFDVKSAGIDFLVGGNLKYLLGTAGIGFLYVRRPLVESLEPTVTGWFAQENIGAMDHTQHRPAPNARRFETGTPPVPNTYAAEAGIRILADVGMANVESRINALVLTVIERARATGYRLITPLEPERHGPMVNIASTDAARLVAELEEAEVVVSCRDNAIRISLHFYNNDRDIDHLFTELGKRSALIHRA
jgi:selenocysteine lyase/cysteine desulfurase